MSERDWEKFHTPSNVALGIKRCSVAVQKLTHDCITALAGECGELCEIFQWMGPVHDANAIAPKKIVHIGEEVADVAIYSIRLADLAGVDLAGALKLRLQAENVSSKRSKSGSGESDDVYFEDLEGFKRASELQSLRIVLFDIQTQLGLLCSTFGHYRERECSVQLPLWLASDKHLLVTSLAEIIIKLTEICTFVGLKCGSCISDKIRKNEAKYPKELVKGSAAKYNEYHDAKRAQQGDDKLQSRAWMFRGTAALFGAAMLAALLLHSRRSV